MKLPILCVLAVQAWAATTFKHEKRGLLLDEALSSDSSAPVSYDARNNIGLPGYSDGFGLKSTQFTNYFTGNSPWDLKSKSLFSEQRITLQKEVPVPLLPRYVPYEVTKYVPFKVEKPYPVIVQHPVSLRIGRPFPVVFSLVPRNFGPGSFYSFTSSRKW